MLDDAVHAAVADSPLCSVALARPPDAGLVSVFTLGSRGQPLVLLLEDWHWSDGGSGDVLEQLTEMISAYPVLLVVTSRPESETGRTLPRAQVHLDLAPLDERSAVEVMRAALLGARVVVVMTGGDHNLVRRSAEQVGASEVVWVGGGGTAIRRPAVINGR